MQDSRDTLRDQALVGRLLAELSAGRPFALATVLATRGSMPRHATARMALLQDGTWLGTVGGGRLEQQMQRRCSDVLAGAAPASLEWMTHAKTGMACGGDALVGVTAWQPGRAALLTELLRRLRAGERFVLREAWRDPSEVTVELLGAGELAAGSAEARALAGQAAVWEEGSRTYVEPAGPDPVCYVFGGGHVGRALTGVLANVGFRVVVADDRPGVAVPADFPAAERVLCGDLRDIAGMGIRVGGADYVVVTTHGHAWDIDVLQQVAAARPAYVGCIGSRGKAAFARKTLRERGVDEAWLDSVHLPIGEDILAVTPAEIAISIAAQMIRCRAELRPPEQRPHADSSRTSDKSL